MKRPYLALALAVGTLLFLGCDLEVYGESQRYKEDFHYDYDFEPDGRLYVENFNGSVEITGWDQNTVDVSGTKYASTTDGLDAIEIDVVASDNTVRVRTIRPSGRRQNMGAQYVIRVPRRIELSRIESSNGSIRVENIEGESRLETSNGRISVQGLKGNLEAKTSNGRLELVALEGNVVAQTSNGRIEANVNAPDPKRPLSFTTSNGSVNVTLDTLNSDLTAKTSNGSITVRLPASISARVDAHTSNSSITSDFDVSVRGNLDKNRLEGTIGAGGPLIDLGTSNGDIKLLKI